MKVVKQAKGEWGNNRESRVYMNVSTHTHVRTYTRVHTMTGW